MIRPEWKRPKGPAPTKDSQPDELEDVPSRDPMGDSAPVTQGQASEEGSTGELDPGTQIDTDMDALTGSLATTSLGLVPASVARKQKKKAQQT